MSEGQKAKPGPDFDQLDPILHHRSRLAACVLLAGEFEMTFSRLKEMLDETDGNLGANLRKLEDAGYLGARKVFQGRKPVTWYSLTAKGRRHLTSHLDCMQRIINTVTRPTSGRR